MASIRTRFPALLVLAAASACLPALSATVVVNVTVDVSSFTPGFGGGVRGPALFSGFSNFTLAAGDQIDYRIDFTGNQTLLINNFDQVFAMAYSADGGNQVTRTTGSLDLLDASGAVLYSAAAKTTDEADVHIGQFFFNSDFSPGMPASFSIGGLHYMATVVSFTPSVPGTDPLITSRSYNDPALYILANSVTPVPEPAQYALLLGGLVLLGAAAARRRPS